MGWRFRILGDLVISRHGELLDLRSERASALVRSLLLRANRPVPFRTLLESVWQTRPADGRNSLHVLVRRLRRALDEDGRVVTGPRGYQIRTCPGELDLDDFTALLDAARAAAEAGDEDGEHRQLTEALLLWPSDAATMPTGDQLVRDLEERRLAAWHRRVELDLECGNVGGAVADLRVLTCHYPMRERLWAQLMTALRQDGRQAEALSVFSEARTVLTDRLGSEPGAELQAMYASVLADDGPAKKRAPVHLGAPLPGAAAVPPADPTDSLGSATAGQPAGGEDGPLPAWTPTNQLPRTIADFVGRHEEISELAGHLQPNGSARVVLVWGGPGVGKSSLAVRVAHELSVEYPDGQWHLVIGDDDPDDLLRTLLLISGMPATRIPERGQARAAALRARLAGRRVLLVLDGATCPEQVLPLLPGTTESAVLLTSRSAMVTFPGISRYRLDPLPVSDGVQLVTEVVGRCTVAQEATNAEELVRLCGAIPLAVRVIAARLLVRPGTSLQQMVDRLRDERNRLDEMAIDGVAVRSSIRLSCDGLAPRLRTALVNTTLLPRSGFTPWALGALTGDDGERLCDALCAAGLLQELGRDVAGQVRLRSHDLVALYAGELAEEVDNTVRRNTVGNLLDTLVGYGRTIDRTAAHVDGELPPDARGATTDALCVPLPGGVDADRWVRAERTTLRTAIEQGCRLGLYAQAALLADLTIPALAVHGDFEPLRHMRTTVRDAARAAGDERLACRAELGLAESSTSYELQVSEQTYLACAEVFERLGATEELVHSLSGLAFCGALRGRPDVRLATRAAEIGRASPCFATRCTTARTLAVVLDRSGRAAGALPVLRAALTDAERENWPAARALLTRDITRSALRAGHLDEAIAWCAQAFLLEPDGTVGRGWLLVLHSRILNASGRTPDAIVTARRAYHLMDRLSNRRGAGSALFRLAEACQAAGQPEAAADAASAALPLLRASGDDYLAGRAENLLGEAAVAD